MCACSVRLCTLSRVRYYFTVRERTCNTTKSNTVAAFTPKYVLKTKVQIRFSYSREQTYNFVKCKQYDDMKR